MDHNAHVLKRVFLFSGILILLTACTSTTALPPQNTIPALPSRTPARSSPTNTVVTSEPAEPTPSTASDETSNSVVNKHTYTGIDPCALITKAEAEEALGEEVSEPDRSQQGWSFYDWCAYRHPGDQDEVVIGLKQQSSEDTFKDFVEEDTGTPVTPVPGLGDEAYAFLGVYTLKGDIAMEVWVDGSKVANTYDERIDVTKKLVEKALARLP